MNPIHLNWIVPLSGFIGFIACARLSVNKEQQPSSDFTHDNKK